MTKQRKFDDRYECDASTCHMAPDQNAAKHAAARYKDCRTVLDACAGAGILSIELAKVVVDKVIAVDIDPEHLDQARKNANIAKVDSRIEFVCGNILDPSVLRGLPALDGAFLDPDWARNRGNVPPSLNRMLPSATDLFWEIHNQTGKIGLRLPPNLPPGELSGFPVYELEKTYVNDKHEFYCAWFGDLAKKSGPTEVHLKGYVAQAMEPKLSPILRVFHWAHALKELPRTGWIIEGSARACSDSIAAHSYSVALLSLLTFRQLKEDFPRLDEAHILRMAILHDLAESLTGEIPTGVKKPLGSWVGRPALFDELEQVALTFLLADITNKSDLEEAISDYQRLDSPDAKVVKFADALDALVHAKVIMNRTFDTFLAGAQTSLRRGCPGCDDGIGNVLAEWLSNAIEHWDAVGWRPPEVSASSAG